MASVSISLTAANSETINPVGNIVTGTNAPGVGDVELRVNTTNITSMKQLYEALENFDWFVKDAKLGPNTFGIL